MTNLCQNISALKISLLKISRFVYLQNHLNMTMNKTNRLVSLALLGIVIAGCEQPAPEAEQESVAEAPAAETSQKKLASIDADGNIAPFGFAAKQPVEVKELATAETAPIELAAATSDLYGIHCVACHGADAKGGLGPNLVDSEFVAASSADELTAFLKVGRSPDSPDSTTGIPMPAFAWMSAENLTEITGYLKGL
jgi:mono/diheme cytochrome c family protein